MLGQRVMPVEEAHVCVPYGYENIEWYEQDVVKYCGNRQHLKDQYDVTFLARISEVPQQAISPNER